MGRNRHTEKKKRSSYVVGIKWFWKQVILLGGDWSEKMRSKYNRKVRLVSDCSSLRPGHEDGLDSGKRQSQVTEERHMVVVRLPALKRSVWHLWMFTQVRWLILCDNLTGPRGVPMKHYSWGCLWGWLWTRLTLELETSKVDRLCEQASSSPVRAWVEWKGGGKRKSLLLLPTCLLR